MKVMVTGADGQLGSELVRQLGDKAFPVPRTALDITDYKAVKRFFQFEKPDFIVNCAAYTNVNAAEYRAQEECRRINTTGVANLLQFVDGACFIQVSTDYVFDGRRGSPYTERSDRNPLNVYGKSKRNAENLVRGLQEFYTLRTSGLYLNGHRNFVTNILAQAKLGKQIKVANDQFAHLTYTPHLAKAIVWFITAKPRYGVYNLANMGITSWYEYAKAICKLGGYDVPIMPRLASEFGGATRPTRTEFNMTKYHDNHDAPSMPTWQSGLMEFFERETNGSTRN